MALATVLMTAMGASHLVNAATFDKKEVEQDKFIAVAAPFGNNQHQLLIIEQISSQRQCWSESGSNPVIVNPLLSEFDFTGICGRSTDSNGYSIRMADEDLGLDYLLRVVERNGELLLVGTNRINRNAPELLIGRVRGTTNGFAKIFLEPGWRFTKRTYEGKTLGHVYLTNDATLASVVGNPTPSPSPSPSPSPTPTPTPGTNYTFRDIASDIYASEIQQAVNLGFVAGFSEDNTFRPQNVLTREQLVSIVIEALGKLPNSNIQVPTQVSSPPYPDVNASRWSAAKIQWAKNNNIISGYTDGTFRPTQPVTRAELMAVERRAAEFAQTLQGRQPSLTAKQSPIQFSDTQGHWADGLISQMSSYCRVASPVNETGSAFSPDAQARRNYATAATLRMFNCVRSEQ